VEIQDFMDKTIFFGCFPFTILATWLHPRAPQEIKEK
jgi:hypothetical protein